MNDKYKQLFETLVSNMVEDYYKTRDLFETNGKIKNKLEFGIYRENVIKSIIKRYLPDRLGIGSGFIITSKGSTSTQCDVIIYDKTNYKKLELYSQRFYPIEIVVGVIEIKSRISIKSLKEALTKLAKIKQMRNDIEDDPIYIFKYKKDESFDLKKCFYDRIGTFLICEKIINYKNESYLDIYCDSYLNNKISNIYTHNMILSLKDGLLMYKENLKNIGDIKYAGATFNGDPHQKVILTTISPSKDNKFLIFFIAYLIRIVSQVSVIELDPINYIYY